MKLYGSDNQGQIIVIDQGPIQQVLNGGMYRSKVKAEGSMYVGLPFTFEGKTMLSFTDIDQK